jgi:Rod binding domain-containing protein
MTLPPATPAGLPVRTPALEPASIRHGSAAVQKQYAVALEFEQMLVTQLASSLTQAGELGGSSSGAEGGTEEEPGASIYSSMFPQALASGIVSGGGLGLAAQLTQQLAGAVPATAAPGQGRTGAAAQGTPAGGLEAPDAGGTSAR